MTEVPLHSTWDYQGHRWRVLCHDTRDGEPAVVIKIPERRGVHTVVTRLFLRKAFRIA